MQGVLSIPEKTRRPTSRQCELKGSFRMSINRRLSSLLSACPRGEQPEPFPKAMAVWSARAFAIPHPSGSHIGRQASRDLP